MQENQIQSSKCVCILRSLISLTIASSEKANSNLFTMTTEMEDFDLVFDRPDI